MASVCIMRKWSTIIKYCIVVQNSASVLFKTLQVTLLYCTRECKYANMSTVKAGGQCQCQSGANSLIDTCQSMHGCRRRRRRSAHSKLESKPTTTQFQFVPVPNCSDRRTLIADRRQLAEFPTKRRSQPIEKGRKWGDQASSNWGIWYRGDSQQDHKEQRKRISSRPRNCRKRKVHIWCI